MLTKVERFRKKKKKLTRWRERFLVLFGNRFFLLLCPSLSFAPPRGERVSTGSRLPWGQRNERRTGGEVSARFFARQQRRFFFFSESLGKRERQ